MTNTDARAWTCPHCGEDFDKPAEGWEDGLGDIHVICPGCDRRTAYPASAGRTEILAAEMADLAGVKDYDAIEWEAL